MKRNPEKVLISSEPPSTEEERWQNPIMHMLPTVAFVIEKWPLCTVAGPLKDGSFRSDDF